MPDRISSSTFQLSEADLPDMVLSDEDLPPKYTDYTLLSERLLDNRTMAEQGFADATEERFREIGRITGFVREFGMPRRRSAADGADFIFGSVAHLFDTPQGVHDWMHDIFLADFERNIGMEVGEGQKLLNATRLDPKGFYDEAVALQTLHDSSGRIISSTIVDFRVGRVLGVVFMATIGNHQRLDEATELSIAMEKIIVGSALSA